MQPPSLGQPALSVLVLLPASAHMTAQNASPLAPIPRPTPLINRKSGSVVPSLKSINNQPQNPSRLRNEDISPDERKVNPLEHVQAGRRSSLAPGLGGGTETRSPDSRHVPKLGAIESSPPGTPDRAASPSGDDQSGDDRKAAFGRYGMTENDESDTSTRTRDSTGPAIPTISTEAPAFGSRKPLSTSTTASARTRRRPQTSAVSRSGQTTQRGSMALPSGTGLGIGGSGIRNRPGWEADEVVSSLRESGLEGMSHCSASVLVPDQHRSYLPPCQNLTCPTAE